MKYHHLVLGAVAIFVYVGAEVSIGSFLVNYFSQPDIGNISEQTAARFVSFYWGGAMMGRFLGSAILRRVRTGKLLAIAAFVACVLVCVSMMTFGHVAMWTIILVGFFNSIMFPSIFTLGIASSARSPATVRGILVMAIVGGAILPVASRLARRSHRHPSRLHSSRPVLHVHRVLRFARLQAHRAGIALTFWVLISS